MNLERIPPAETLIKRERIIAAIAAGCITLNAATETLGEIEKARGAAKEGAYAAELFQKPAAEKDITGEETLKRIEKELFETPSVERLFEKTVDGHEGDVLSLQEDLKKVARESSHEWSFTLFEKDGQLTLGNPARGSETSGDLAAYGAAQKYAEAHGVEMTYNVHTHPMSNSFAHVSEDKFADFRKEYGIQKYDEKMASTQAELVSQGKLPAPLAPPSVGDISGAVRLQHEYGDGKVTNIVGEPNEVWRYEYVADTGHSMMYNELYGSNTDDLERSKLAKQVEEDEREYTVMHCRLLSPYPPEAVEAFLKGEHEPLEKELEQRRELAQKMADFAKDKWSVTIEPLDGKITNDLNSVRE